jgi:hypothetical protein
MSNMKVVLLQIVSIASIVAAGQQETYCLQHLHDNTDITDPSVLDSLWTPKVTSGTLASLDITVLDGAIIESVDLKTMTSWSGGGSSLYDSQSLTAIKVKGDWYVAVHEDGDYDWW